MPSVQAVLLVRVHPNIGEVMPNHLNILSNNQRLSESLLWDLQRRFFESSGVNAWRNEIVPQYITSNPHIAHAYVRTIFAYIRDIVETLDSTQPVYIVELGAGSGRLAYHVLKALWDFFDISTLRDVPLTYVLTDFSQSTLEFWRTHPQLQPWVDAGKLDFALFDAESSTMVDLVHAGVRLSADTLKNPMIFVANYFFDGLRSDVFRLQYGDLQESLLTLLAPDDADTHNPAILDQLEMRYHHRTVTTDYYANPDYNALLAFYLATLDLTYLVFPMGSLDCIGRLLQMTNNRFFMLTGDKGYHHMYDLMSRGEPTIKMHGSFSMMVNYHVIGEYIRQQGGQFIGTDHHHASLDICALIAGDGGTDYTETRQAFTREIVGASPDDMYTLKGFVDEQLEDLDIEQFLAYLRLNHWDSSTFLDYAPVLLEVAADVSESVRQALFHATEAVWERYYDIGEVDDLAGMIGQLLYELDYPDDAIAYFQQSMQSNGKTAMTFYYIAQCYFELDDLPQAQNYVLQSLALSPDDELAQILEARIQRERDNA
jgi:tetratricopeptide (TPR) repeat protein